MSTLYVTLAAGPPEASHLGGHSVEAHRVPVGSLDEASAKVNEFIASNSLGASSWYGGSPDVGLVVDEKGNQVARIAYNGRVFR